MAAFLHQAENIDYQHVTRYKTLRHSLRYNFSLPKGPYHTAKRPLLHHDMAYIAMRYGLYCNAKRPKRECKTANIARFLRKNML